MKSEQLVLVFSCNTIVVVKVMMDTGKDMNDGQNRKQKKEGKFVGTSTGK